LQKYFADRNKAGANNRDQSIQARNFKISSERRKYVSSLGGKASKKFAGKTHTQEHKDKLAELGRLRPATDKMKDNMRHVGLKNGGFHHTEKHLLSVINVGKNNLGKKHSIETRVKHMKNKDILQNICAISPNGEIAHFKNVIDASDSLNLPRHRIENLVKTGKSRIQSDR
jgi:hypothetical protein